MTRMNVSMAALAGLMVFAASAPVRADDAALAARIDKLLAKTPVIDGHNDLPWEIRSRFDGDLAKVDLSKDTKSLPLPTDRVEPPLMSDIPRMRKGRLGGQFWSVWVPSTEPGPKAVELTVEQIDLVKRMVAAWPDALEMAYTAADIRRIQKAGKVASLIGIEGGHQIDSSLAVLRQMYALGARYMTLSHAINTPWVDAATDTPTHHGLTDFGKQVVREMNRLGMLVDISHVSAESMMSVLDTTTAPVIFSHSGARAIDDHPRNVPDDVLKRVARNRGVVMVNFYPGYVSEAYARWESDRAAEQTRLNAPPFAGRYIGQPDRAKAALADWDKAHPAPEVTIAMVADHFDHIAKICGVDCVGIGSDFDGIPVAPTGLDGVDKYPALFMELARRGWSDKDLEKLAGGNILRALAEAERVAGAESHSVR